MSEGKASVPPRVLVVDDDDGIRALLTRYLKLEGYAVEEAADGQAAVSAVERRTPDLVLLDRMLPAHDGLDILARMRRITDVPIILLTAMGAEGDRVLGLKLGADDYVVKPFSPPELVARISSVLRRTQSSRPPSRLEFEGLMVDLSCREVAVAGKPVEVTLGSSTSWCSWPRRPARSSPASRSSTGCGPRRRSGRTQPPSPSTSAVSAVTSRPIPTSPAGSRRCGASATASSRRPV